MTAQWTDGRCGVKLPASINIGITSWALVEVAPDVILTDSLTGDGLRMDLAEHTSLLPHRVLRDKH